MRNTNDPLADEADEVLQVAEAQDIEDFHQQVRRPSRVPFFMVLLVMLIGMGLGGVCYHQISSQIDAQNAQIDSIGKIMQNGARASNDLMHQVKHLQRRFNDQQQKISSNLESLERLEHQRYDSQTDVELRSSASALQLIRWLITYQRDVKSAIALLENVKLRLAELSKSAFGPVLDALDHDIQKLKAVSVVPFAKVLSTLDVLDKKIPQLTPKTRQTHQNQNIKPAAMNEEDAKRVTSIQERWLRAFKNIVTIRRHKDGAIPLLLPENRLILEQNLLWLVQQAKWAVLHQHHGVYQSSLDQLKQWLVTYFEHQSPSKDILKDINALQDINIAPDLPNVEGSEQALRDLLKSQQLARQQKPIFTKAADSMGEKQS